jgi:hypothetical protein
MAKTTKGKRTAASVIRDGLQKGQSDAKILARVKRAVPTSRADQRHVDYYRRELGLKRKKR